MKRFFCFFLVFLIVLANISLLVRFNEEKVVNSDKELSREPYQEVVEGGDITELEEQIAALIAEIATLNEQIDGLEFEIADLIARVEELEGESGSDGGSSGDDSGESGDDSGGSTDQNALAGAYTDGTFTTRAYTWDELVARGDLAKNGGIFAEENQPAIGVAPGGGIWLWASDYYIVVPDTVTTCFQTESGFKGVVLPATTTSFGHLWESYGSDTMGTVYIKATEPPKLPCEDYFSDCNFPDGHVTIIVPIGCREAYIADEYWAQYGDHIFEGEMPI